jgi:Holliday junction resolvase RusA-like endonuclease
MVTAAGRSVTALSVIENAPLVEFTVHGEPKGAGSKKAFRTPSGHMNVTESIKGSKAWQHQVAQVAAQAWGGELLDGPLVVHFDFYAPRPRAHFGTGRNAGTVKSSAPARPTTRPDVLKLARAVEDALTGTVWRDDSQIVEERLSKHYGKSRVEIKVWAMLAAPTTQTTNYVSVAA